MRYNWFQYDLNSIKITGCIKKKSASIPMWKNITDLIDVKHCRESWKTYYEAAQICKVIYLTKKHIP